MECGEGSGQAGGRLTETESAHGACGRDGTEEVEPAGAGDRNSRQKRIGTLQDVEELAYAEGPLSMAEVISPGKMFERLMNRSGKISCGEI